MGHAAMRARHIFWFILVLGTWKVTSSVQEGEECARECWHCSCKKFAELRLCGFKTSVGFTKSLINGINTAASKEVLSKFPQDLPVLVIWGSTDPVTKTDFGTESADQIQMQMKAAGKALTKTIAYIGARHEVLLDWGASATAHLEDVGTWATSVQMVAS